MSWNYRIIEDGEGIQKYYSLREVFYNDKNKVRGFSIEPEAPIGDRVEDLIKNIEMMLRDAKKSRNNVLKSDMECAGWDE